jgi:hypothetical protein
MLERIIAEADNKLINTLTSQQQNDYYDMKITLRSSVKREPLRNELLTG